MKIYQILGFILLAIVLSSCGRKFIFHNDLNTVEKGQNIDILRDQIDIEPKYSFCFENDGNIFCCDIYKLVYDTYTYTYTTTSTSNGMTTSSTKTETEYYTTDFCMLYLNNNFHYCFIVNDINKEEDTLTRNIAPIFITKYLEIK